MLCCRKYGRDDLAKRTLMNCTFMYFLSMCLTNCLYQQIQVISYVSNLLYNKLHKILQLSILSHLPNLIAIAIKLISIQGIFIWRNQRHELLREMPTEYRGVCQLVKRPTTLVRISQHSRIFGDIRMYHPNLPVLGRCLSWKPLAWSPIFIWNDNELVANSIEGINHVGLEYVLVDMLKSFKQQISVPVQELQFGIFNFHIYIL